MPIQNSFELAEVAVAYVAVNLKTLMYDMKKEVYVSPTIKEIQEQLYSPSESVHALVGVNADAAY